MTASMLRMAYQMRYHRVGRWGLDQWLAIVAFAGAAILTYAWRVPLSSGSWGGWLVVGLLALLGLTILIVHRMAARRAYVIFSPDSTRMPPPGNPMPPADKLLLHATGLFTVEGKYRFFADLLAYWRTFATREHAVMAIVHARRFLLLGSVPAEDAGMWYIFFQPAMVRSLSAGSLSFGALTQPALRVVYEDPDSGPKRRRPQPQTVYLGFDSEDDRERAWSDLLADGSPAE